MKYIGVTGSREFTDAKILNNQLSQLLLQHQYITIVSGGAKGADSIAANYARDKIINLIEYLPDYEKYGKSAPFIRNKLIAEKCDILIACFKSGLPCNGTKDTVLKALNKPVIFLMQQ